MGIANVFKPLNDQLAFFIDYFAFSTTKRCLSATAKPTHLATATHATIVVNALAIHPLASVTDLAVRNERNSSSNNNNVKTLGPTTFISRFLQESPSESWGIST